MNPRIWLRFAFLVFLMIPFISFSQTAGSNTISGTVVDSATLKVLEYTTVALKNGGDKPFKTTLTSSKGTFSFKALSQGKYKVSIVSVGYMSISIPVETKGENDIIDLGMIKLSSQKTQLNEVTITGDRPLVKQEIDRIAYDVQADPENKLDNVLDMLRKVPLVSIDADDNIQVKGSASFKVLINGRPSSIVARNPKDVFKSMPASNIQKIEIITTPPAKYDGEGLAGIINIITNKNVDQGYNGSVSTSFNSPNEQGLNGQLTVKGKKIGLSTYIGSNWRDRPNTTFSLSRTSLPSNDMLVTSGERGNKSNYMYSNLELSYEIDTLNLLTSEFGYNDGEGGNDNFQTINRIFSGNTESYNIDNKNEYGWKGYELGLNYQLGFKRNKEQLLTASYKYNNSTDDSESTFFASQHYNNENDYGQNNQSGSNEQTIQLDYLHPVKKLNIEGGLKLILRDNFSDYEYGTYDNPISRNYQVDEERSNNFNYRQDVYSFYNSYQLKLNDWGLKAGLRLEQTLINADFTSLNTVLKTDYQNFIPSVSVQRKFKKSQSLNLGYTQRIQRPSIWQLNPYEEQFNSSFTQAGNTELKPVLNHNIELNYSMFSKGSINTGLSYSFANNTIQYVNRLVGSVSRATFENIGKNRNLGVNISTNQEIKSFSINVNGRLSYIWMEGMIDNNLLKNEGVQGNIYANAGYKFKNDFRAGLNSGFYSAWISLQGQSNPYFYTSASLSKEFLKKKATVSASVNNPFQQFRNWKNDTYDTSFIQTERFQNYYRTFRLNLNYKFGQLNSSIKKNQRGINNDDVAGKSK